jgi:hypothetical protein
VQLEYQADQTRLFQSDFAIAKPDEADELFGLGQNIHISNGVFSNSRLNTSAL